MARPIDRRYLLAGLGTAGVGTLLAACGGGDGDGASPSSSGSGGSGGSATTAGTAATGAGDVAALFDEATSCALTPEQTEGPFYIDVDAVRSDIREDREGVPLRLGVRVLDEACAPVPDAIVEVWHCDATGLYSGFEAASRGGSGGGGGEGGDGTRYLRGGQATDGDGIAQFTTVYPGWYQGRTIHVHAKAHVGNGEVLTTQLYFDEDVTAAVQEREPYASDTGRDTFNDDDGIFSDATLLTLSEDGDGYLGLITLTVDRS